MRFEIKSFKSKVSRRIFFLFVICALLPLWGLGWISYSLVKQEVMKQNCSRMRQACGVISVSLYERLLLVESEMEILCGILESHENSLFKTPLEHMNRNLRDRFNALALRLPDGSHFPLVGEMPTFPGLQPDQKDFLFQEGALLLLENGNSGTHRIFMFHPVAGGDLEKSILISDVRADYLWQAADLRPSSSELIVTGPAGVLLFSTIPGLRDSTVPMSAPSGVKGHGVYEWKNRAQGYYVGTSHIYLNSRFFSADWHVSVAEPKDKWLHPVQRFGLIFPAVFIFTLALIVLLSVGQIRKTTRPIEILKNGTHKIATGELDHRVAIHSGDEFEGLAASFNEMAAKIKESQSLMVRTAKMSTIGQMAAGIFHEIKQPLTAVYGLLELTLMQGFTEKSRQNLEKALQGAKRMNRILTRFKTFSHISEGDMGVVSLNLTIREVYALFEYQLNKTGVRCDLSLSPSLPEIMGDDQALQQVVTNLLINAIDALEGVPPGEKQVYINTFSMEEKVCLQVADNGCGMPEEIREKVFDPFFTTKDPKKGTGLGMAIIENILHQHRADIQLGSDPGRGTEITIAFPSIQEMKQRPSEKDQPKTEWNEEPTYLQKPLSMH
jgi:signal transduction histidine kinase